MPTVSFIIPVKPGGEVAALAALRRVDGSCCPFEVLVAEGCAPSSQRNAAVGESCGDILYFLDDDSLVVPECLAICAGAMEDSSVAAAGGPSLTPVDDSPLQQLFGSAMSSIFGAGAARNRYRADGVLRETTDRELILCNLAIRREVFLALGGFDERLYPNEENELLDRILTSGLRLVHVPDMSVQRSQRGSLRQFIRQMFSYGRGRAQQTLISASVSIISFAPLLFVAYLIGLLFMPGNVLILTPLITYIVLDGIFSLTAVCVSGVLSRSLLLFIFPLMHIANGCGLLWGLIGGVPEAPAGTPDTVTVRRIKAFDQLLW